MAAHQSLFDGYQPRNEDERDLMKKLLLDLEQKIVPQRDHIEKDETEAAILASMVLIGNSLHLSPQEHKHDLQLMVNLSEVLIRKVEGDASVKELSEEIRMIEASLVAKKEQLRLKKVGKTIDWAVINYSNLNEITRHVFPNEAAARDWASLNCHDGKYTIEERKLFTSE